MIGDIRHSVCMQTPFPCVIDLQPCYRALALSAKLMNFLEFPLYCADLPSESLEQLLQEQGISVPPKAEKGQLADLLYEKAVKVRIREQSRSASIKASALHAM